MSYWSIHQFPNNSMARTTACRRVTIPGATISNGIEQTTKVCLVKGESNARVKANGDRYVCLAQWRWGCSYHAAEKRVTGSILYIYECLPLIIVELLDYQFLLFPIHSGEASIGPLRGSRPRIAQKVSNEAEADVEP